MFVTAIKNDFKVLIQIQGHLFEKMREDWPLLSHLTN